MPPTPTSQGGGASNGPTTKLTDMCSSLTFKQEILGEAAAENDNGVKAEPGDKDHQDNNDNDDENDNDDNDNDDNNDDDDNDDNNEDNNEDNDDNDNDNHDDNDDNNEDNDDNHDGDGGGFASTGGSQSGVQLVCHQ
jgi:hypothetical protein